MQRHCAQSSPPHGCSPRKGRKRPLGGRSHVAVRAFLLPVGLVGLLTGFTRAGVLVAADAGDTRHSTGGNNAGAWRPHPPTAPPLPSDGFSPQPRHEAGGAGGERRSWHGARARGGSAPEHWSAGGAGEERESRGGGPYAGAARASHPPPLRQDCPSPWQAGQSWEGGGREGGGREARQAGGERGGQRGRWESGPSPAPPHPPGRPYPDEGSIVRERASAPDPEASLLASRPPPTAPPGPSEPPWQAADLTVLDKEQFFEELKRLYRKKVLPLELASKYAQFHSAPLNPADFEAKPMVLLLGQYSVGKTSFIRSLLQGDFPGQRVGPEPTTDRFMAVMHGPEPRLVPGHALAMQADKPFRGVASFGNNFLTKFEAAEVPAPILRNITLIDSPGILSGEKQRLGRDYDYQAVIQWFADRADLIIIMFDAHKLDISDELRIVMDALRIHQDKIRILLNKADQIDSQQLMRIYGALMWSLGKVVNTPEVCRVYIGSFWEHPLKHSQNRFLLEKEKADLLAELDGLPQNAVVRRINELVKRARSVKVHAYLIHYLRKQVPTVFGKSEKQAKLLQTLPREFVACARRYGLPLGDFPDINKFRARLGEVKDLRKFPKLDKAMVQEMDRVFSHDIPKLVEKASRQPQYGSREAGDHYAREWRR